MKKLATILLAVGVVFALCPAAEAAILEVDFDSLTTGEIDNGGATTAQLNAATTGGTWDLNSDSAVTHQIQDDAAGGGSTDRGFSSRAASGKWGAGLDLDNAVDIDTMTNDLVITFTSGTVNSTGFDRDAHWRLFDGAAELVDIEIDDGNVLLNGSNKGSLFGASDPNKMGTTWDTGSGFLLDFSITIDNSGNVDMSVNDHGGSGSTDTVTGSTTIASTAEIDRLETDWKNGSMGIYFGEITIIPEPASLALIALGLPLVLKRRRR